MGVQDLASQAKSVVGSAEEQIKALLRQSGVPEATISGLNRADFEILARTPGMLEGFISAQGTVVNEYEMALSQAGFGSPSLGPAPTEKLQPGFAAGVLPGQSLPGNMASMVDQSPLTADEGGVRTSLVNGAILYKNGIYADPVNNAVIFPPSGPGAVAKGSEPWLAKVVRTWDESKANEWRRRLTRLGSPYVKARSGGMGIDLVDALRDYYKQQYIYGKTVPYGPDGSAGATTAERHFADDAEIRQGIRAQYQVTLKRNPSDAEIDDWLSFVKTTTRKGIRKGLTPGQAYQSAQARASEAIEQDPMVRYLNEDAGTTEEERGMADFISSVAGVMGSFG